MTDVEHTTQSIAGGQRMRGFALPTILITSIVMLMVLLVSVSSTVAVRTAMQNQYYAQLAQVAGEAGITYAHACLDANAGVPQWSDANPLRSNTDCLGNALVDCSASPLDPLCAVTRNGNIRSNFSIGSPQLDASGNVTNLPNTGFVEILRTSNNAVWRRYEQKSIPTDSVPDLCSGKATTALGWSNAIVAGTGNPFPEPSAKQIKNVAGTPNTGSMYFRKDFNVTQAGSYVISNMADDSDEVSIDGRLVSKVVWTAVDTTTVNLAVGCHTVVAKLTNNGLAPNPAGLSFSLKLSGASSPLVVSDTTWRVSSGDLFHYSSPSYQAGTSGWSAARAIQLWSAITPVWTAVPSPAWNTSTGDSSAYWISTTHSYTSTASYPANSTTIFRNTDNITVAVPTQVKLGYVCDDSCTIWVDGNQVAIDTEGSTLTRTTTVTLAEGPHQFGVSLTNINLGAAGFLFAAVDTATGTVLTSSDATWKAAVAWYATDPDPSSYDRLYTPNPPIERGINIAPDFSLWTLAGGASYDAGTGILTMPTTGTATSPAVRVDKPTGFAGVGADFYATTASPYASFAPNGGYYLGITYFGSDGTTPAYNSANYAANGCANSISLSVWSLADARCSWFLGGPNVRYAILKFYGGTYSSPDLIMKNPIIILR